LFSLVKPINTGSRGEIFFERIALVRAGFTATLISSFLYS
jgi:hypothetical protein